MNAPPGVDTDTSGEEFTPPPSPAAEEHKAEFSLTSLLPTNKLNKLRRPKADIKTQTPEQASESVNSPKSDRTRTRLAKKRVRIAENERDQNSAVRPPANVPDEVVEHASRDATQMTIADADSTRIIALLREMMVKNVSESEDTVTDGINFQATPGSMVSTAQNGSENIQLPTPTGSSFAKRPGGLDFSNLFRAKGKDKPASGFPVESPPGHSTNQADLSITSETGSSTCQPSPTDPPKTDPPWLWTGPYQAMAGPTTQHGPPGARPAVSPSNPAYPPWLWQGPLRHQGADQYGTSAAPPKSYAPEGALAHWANGPWPHLNHPPFPPYYPHPQSLQPWQPYYPSWATPQPTDEGPTQCHDTAGVPPLGSTQDVSEHPGPHTPSLPLTSAADNQGDSAPTSPKAEKQMSQLNKPKLRSAANVAKRPTETNAPSTAESMMPEHGIEEPLIRHGDSPTPADKHKNHLRKALRSARVVRAPDKKDDGQQSVESPTSRQPKSSTWAECLLSLATCIRM